MTPSATVTGPVEPGSVVHLNDVTLGADGFDALRAEIARAAGHEDFVLLLTEGGSDVQVWHAEDAAYRLRELLGWPHPTPDEPTPIVHDDASGRL